MIYLLLSIAASVSVSVLLKIARRQNFAISHAIAVNYLIATALCWFVLKPDLSATDALISQWPIFAALGLLLPTVFIIMGKAVAEVGIVKSDAAQRLSLFLPILAAFTLFGESLSPIKLSGIILAFIALCALIYGGKGNTKRQQGIAQTALLLLGVWAGYGVIDILFKHIAKSGAAFSSILLVSFILAGVVMFAYLLAKGSRWSMRDVLAGLLLGVLNFANILFYIRAHQAMSDNPSLVFAGMNLGVISLGTLIGAAAFGEKIRAINALGITLAMAAIIVLFYGQRIF
ncbi:DMT family transporter [Suttonella sp. R2A3]|uniref:DMT family transporter n=1 Tax=Suttonella sp. R2A3 TaxID=2908648 RepID=UPI001F3BCEB4|nr:DMT family transporter [Suttonella sp. R2A3]UJF25266.1 DMT family transporter [Suttonella sp. R2A3]